MKQDLNGVRTAQDLERKYDLSAIAGTKKAVQQAEKTLTKVENETSNLLESLIINLDGVILSGSISLWFYNATPTLENSPASSWTTNELKNAHLNDLYYDRETGYVYKFVSGYKWEKQLDGQLVQSMALTNASIDTTDHERQIFFETTPTPPYNNGDWLVKENGDLYICQITKESNQTYHPDDFIISSQYTYGTQANHKGNVLTVTSGRITKVEVGVDELNSTMTETVNGLTTAQSQILQNTNNINLKVSKNDVINQINVSTEGVSIKANKIALEGYTTINNGFSVDTSGNMTCNNATIKGSSLTLSDNTEIVGNSGLLTTMMIEANMKSNQFIGGTCLLPLGFSQVGETSYSKDFLEFAFEIPSDFVIKSAYIILEHVPVRYSEEGVYKRTGNSRKLELYKATNPLSSMFTLDIGYYTIGYNSTFTKIDGALGFTGSSTTGTKSNPVELKSHIVSGFNLLKIETTETTPTSYEDAQLKSGACKATLYINGYTKFK